MRKLNEAVVSPDVKQIIDCITLKDWQRAYNTKQSLLPSMMNKITDPKKKVGRAAALFLLGRMKGTELSKYLDAAIYNSFASEETRADRIYKGVRNYTNGYAWLPKMTDEEEGALVCEGAEAERYEGIVQQLKAGFTTCYDFDGNYPVEGFSQKDVLKAVASKLN